MPRGGPGKAGGPSKKGAKATVTILTGGMEKDEIPYLPDAADWLVNKNDEDWDVEPEWSPVVEKWWEDIWTSPMANEFLKADLHGLFMACYYLHESVNPNYKLADRLTAGKAFENSIKAYGLNPQARSALRWQVAQGETAQRRTDRMRDEARAEQKKKMSSGGMQDLYRRNG